jgi:hypothetical protein
MRRTVSIRLGALAGMGFLIFLPMTVRAEAYRGYTLYSPNGGTSTYLVDMSNTRVHSWNHTRPGGYSAYLLPDGNIIRPALSTNSSLNGGAAAGLVQEYDPNSVLIWQYQYSSNSIRSHHDIEPMPNGNVLLIAWERKTATEAVQNGLDTTAEIWPDHIVEIQPVGSSGGNIVWEWHAWDHLIQDHDPSKLNYGVVGDHPELLDINMGGVGGMGGGDWMHVNSVKYNPEWDQIIFSSHNLNEIYVVDHSTTTLEAAGHSGGRSGKGGDILYRWGCPANYRAPGSAYFDVVHCGSWVPAGLPGAGHMMAFNNRDGQGTSIVVEWAAPADEDGNYMLTPGQAYGPSAPSWTFTASWFYSNHLGGCQRLPNGNTLVVESTVGNMIEVNAAGVTQWSYQPGGEVARALRYGTTYSGLIPLGLATDVEEADGALQPELGQNAPNPFNVSTIIHYSVPTRSHVSLKLYDAQGREISVLVDRAEEGGVRSVNYNATGLPGGIYFYRLRVGEAVMTRKLVIRP